MVLQRWRRWLIAAVAVAGLGIGAGPSAEAAQFTDPEGLFPGDARDDCVRGTFLSFHGQKAPGDPPDGWPADATFFELSQEYPVTHPGFRYYEEADQEGNGSYNEWLAKQAPWLAEPVDDLMDGDAAMDYINAVKTYALDGNTDVGVDWAGQDNKTRTWYHVPWLTFLATGREPQHGLIQELASKPGTLSPHQVDYFQTWAVSMYNELGGWAVGQVWCDPTAPDLDLLNPNDEEPNWFPNGTAAVKLLFTTATVDQVPYLAGTKQWTAQIPPALGSDRSSPPDPILEERTVRLLQMDIAVRDDRLPLGWAFMTFMYDTKARGTTVWERMVPVGLQWGNDPGITPDMQRIRGITLQESWINPDGPDVQGNHLGWGGRLAGPLDNQNSSCMSCHQTSGSPSAPILPEMVDWFSKDQRGVVTPQRDRLAWFANVAAGETFSYTERQSADFSLQLSDSLAWFYVANCDPRAEDYRYSSRGDGRPAPAEVAAETCEQLAQTVENATSSSVAPSPPRTSPWIYVAIAVAALGLGVVLTWWWERRRQKRAAPA